MQLESPITITHSPPFMPFAFQIHLVRVLRTTSTVVGPSQPRPLEVVHEEAVLVRCVLNSRATVCAAACEPVYATGVSEHRQGHQVSNSNIFKPGALTTGSVELAAPFRFAPNATTTRARVPCEAVARSSRLRSPLALPLEGTQQRK